MDSLEPQSPDPSASQGGTTGTDPEPPVPSAVSSYDEPLVSKGTRTGIAITITAVWAIGLLADAYSTKFSLPWQVHTIMFCTAAAIFGGTAFLKGLKP